MAKMFYTLDEAAERLGVDASEIKQMASEGKLQQFRDRDKLMFKREQVDQLTGGPAADSGTALPLADSASDTDAIDLKDATDATGQTQSGTEGTGVSVFDSGELEAVDPAAQTQVTQASEDEDLALESVGSGSGLLDLTRESDDTSLGAAELLEEISSGSAQSGGGSAVGSSGVFESAIAMEPGQSPGLEAGAPAPGATMAVTYDAEAFDAAGSGFGAGMLAGALIAQIIGLVVVIGWIGGVHVPLAQMMTESGTHLMMWTAGLIVVSLALGVIGLVIGKAIDR